MPWSRLTFTGASRQPGRLIFDFTGSFACKASTEGVTEVTHSYEFSFKGPFRRVEKKLALWLQQEIDLEMKNLAAALTKQK